MIDLSVATSTEKNVLYDTRARANVLYDKFNLTDDSRHGRIRSDDGNTPKSPTLTHGLRTCPGAFGDPCLVVQRMGCGKFDGYRARPLRQLNEYFFQAVCD